VCLLRGTFCPHSVFMCFVWIWEQAAIISLYSINWLVFITETECVYCAVRSAHTVFMCFVRISEQTAIISLYSINWLICITYTECVYCAVRVEFVLVIIAKAALSDGEAFYEVFLFYPANWFAFSGCTLERGIGAEAAAVCFRWYSHICLQLLRKTT
jgi:hypothetical protein